MQTFNSLLNQAVTGGTSPIKSPWVGLGTQKQHSLQLSTTGTLTGTWKIEASNVAGADTLDDPEAALPADVTAAFLGAGGTAPANPTGAPTSQLVACAGDNSLIITGYLRASFTRVSGSGTILAALNKI
jgi:hypothetical protein